LADRYPTQCIAIAPEELALTYVSNSTILDFFSGLGVNLDPFFKLLWRHIIVVEILSRYADSLPVDKPKSIVDWLRSRFSSGSRSDKDMQGAIDYLNEWGQDFWLDTEFRVREITAKLETDLKATIEGKLGVSFNKLHAGMAGSTASSVLVSEQQKAELLKLGQDVVSRAQVRDLHNVMKLLGNVLEHSGRDYLVLMDRLDENWVDEKLRYKLIMALLETAKEFVKVPHAKVIVALRRDLLSRVFRLTRESGFQEEKYDSLCVPISWTQDQLVDLLDRRIDRLVKRRYTKKTVTHRDVLPKQYKRQDVTAYFVERAIRPRDMIAFFNACISAAPRLAKLTVDQFKAAEGDYSRGRLRALGDEWSGDYAQLLDCTRLLVKKRQGVLVSELDEAQVEELALDLAISQPSGSGALGGAAKAVVDCVADAAEFRSLLVNVFYVVGLIGLKPRTFDSTSWADEHGRGISSAEIQETTRIYLHPMYHRVLGIGPDAEPVHPT
jgi:hypothetical protein